MKTPSVTGRNAQVPYRPDPEITALAFWSTTVSLLTRHSKVELPTLLSERAGDPRQPTAEAKASYDCEGAESLYPCCCGRNGDAAMALPKREFPRVPPKAIACSMTAPAIMVPLFS